MSSPPAFDDKDVVSRVDTVVATDMDGEIIMMSVETGRYFHLDDIATEVWHVLEEPRSIAEIIANLRNSYDVSEEQCRLDTFNLLATLCDNGVLKVARA